MARGPDGERSSYAPALSNSLKTMNYADFANVVVNGRKNVNTAQEESTPFRADDRKSMRTSPRAAA
jgi:hypothetical protein